jgi:KUP system potassium uptake protein
MGHSHDSHSKLSLAGLLITVGIIFGDIGTSPLYVMKSIIGTKALTESLVLGAISCVFWTLTLQTTLKYVLITLRADNNGEGGIFSLYTLVRREKAWLVLPAMVGGAALIADGIITPPISISSAIEGLRIFDPAIPTVLITMAIITGIFLIQQFGTDTIGKAFGPVMLVWFVMLGTLGVMNIGAYPLVIKALNPYYAFTLLVTTPGGFWLLGAVFLCTTGAEALYSDLGHCGRLNIQFSWSFVKVMLLLNYAGQGAWLLSFGQSIGQPTLPPNVNPFYAMMPQWFVPIGIVVATLAAIIASQALITGSFTLFSEAIKLHIWPRLSIRYPSEARGQMYIPAVNWGLFVGCLMIVAYFRESSHMEHAYGIAITLAMLSTTILLGAYMRAHGYPRLMAFAAPALFVVIESAFLAANLSKLHEGGWVALVVMGVLLVVMVIWYSARGIMRQLAQSVRTDDYLPQLVELSHDTSVPKFATHLVYLNKESNNDLLDRTIIYSIIEKQPKRADIYWFVHVETTDQPYTAEYEVEHLADNDVIRVRMFLGFRMPRRINSFFRQVVKELERSGEVDTTSRYFSLNHHKITGDFKFVVMDEYLSSEYGRFTGLEKLVVEAYFFLKRFSISVVDDFELDLSSVYVEKVPVTTHAHERIKLKRLAAQS